MSCLTAPDPVSMTEVTFNFVGMNPEINLREHQRNAVAHVLYGGTTPCLAHEVGAGKSFEMAASAMEAETSGLVPEKSLCRAKPFDGTMGQRIFDACTPMQSCWCTSKKDFEPS